MSIKQLGYLMICISFCLSAFGQKKVTILDHKNRINTENMGVLNSPSRETNLSITPDGEYIYFVSFRGGQQWSNKYMTWKSDSIWDGDIWYAEKVNGKWKSPKPMPFGINTSSGEDEPNVLHGGSVVYYQSWNRLWMHTGGPYYRAKRRGSQWGKPEGLGGGITEFFRFYEATDGMAISPDEKLFIVAAGMDYEISEKMDLYISKKTSDGWSYCKRAAISTSGNERSVFLAGDGKTLYFASDGYKGYGGMDIFKTTINSDGTFGEVINIGKPFNTEKDDYGFILTEDGNESYFLRDGDIYFADLTEADERIKPGVEIASEDIEIQLTGTIKNRRDWKAVDAQLVLLNEQTKMPVRSVRTDNSGNYSIKLKNLDNQYVLIVSADGFEKATRKLDVKAQSSSYVYKTNFLLTPEDQESGIAENAPNVASSQGETIIQESTPSNEVPSPTPPKPTVASEPSTVEADKPTPPAELQTEDPYDFEDVADNHLILLLDVSESMSKEGRLPMLKDSFTKLLGYMRDRDRISIVVYSGDVDIFLENVSAKEVNRISEVIDELSSGGATMGQSGLLTAYKLALKNYISGGNNRIIMATDGEFNVDPLLPIAEQNAKRSIALSVFSFNTQNREKLQKLALKGGGNYALLTQQNIEQALLAEAKAVRK